MKIEKKKKQNPGVKTPEKINIYLQTSIPKSFISLEVG